VVDAKTREFAGDVFRRFEAIRIESDGSISLPPDVHRDLVDLALDVLGGQASRGKAGAPDILRILTRAGTLGIDLPQDRPVMANAIGSALEAFILEHEYCGELDAAVEADRVWMTCTCGAAMVRAVESLPEREGPRCC